MLLSSPVRHRALGGSLRILFENHWYLLSSFLPDKAKCGIAYCTRNLLLHNEGLRLECLLRASSNGWWLYNTESPQEITSTHITGMTILAREHNLSTKLSSISQIEKYKQRQTDFRNLLYMFINYWDRRWNYTLMGKVHYYNTDNTDLWDGTLLQVSYTAEDVASSLCSRDHRSRLLSL